MPTTTNYNPDASAQPSLLEVTRRVQEAATSPLLEAVKQAAASPLLEAARHFQEMRAASSPLVEAARHIHELKDLAGAALAEHVREIDTLSTLAQHVSETTELASIQSSLAALAEHAQQANHSAFQPSIAIIAEHVQQIAGLARLRSSIAAVAEQLTSHSTAFQSPVAALAEQIQQMVNSFAFQPPIAAAATLIQDALIQAGGQISCDADWIAQAADRAWQHREDFQRPHGVSAPAQAPSDSTPTTQHLSQEWIEQAIAAGFQTWAATYAKTQKGEWRDMVQVVANIAGIMSTILVLMTFFSAMLSAPSTPDAPQSSPGCVTTPTPSPLASPTPDQPTATP